MLARAAASRSISGVAECSRGRPAAPGHVAGKPQANGRQAFDAGREPGKKFCLGRIFRLTLPASAGITYVKLAQHKIHGIPDVRPHDLVG